MNKAVLETSSSTPSPLASGEVRRPVSKKRGRDGAHLCLQAPVGAQHSLAQSQRQVGKSDITSVALARDKQWDLQEEAEERPGQGATGRERRGEVQRGRCI
jgi:hypothetical protein